jgi:hypothetical protein
MLFKLLEAENPMRDSQNIGFLVTPDGFLAADVVSWESLVREADGPRRCTLNDAARVRHRLSG